MSRHDRKDRYIRVWIMSDTPQFMIDLIANQVPISSADHPQGGGYNFSIATSLPRTNTCAQRQRNGHSAKVCQPSWTQAHCCESALHSGKLIFGPTHPPFLHECTEAILYDTLCHISYVSYVSFSFELGISWDSCEKLLELLFQRLSHCQNRVLLPPYHSRLSI